MQELPIPWQYACQCQRTYSSTRKQNVAIAIFADIRIGLHDRLKYNIMDSACLLANEVGLKQYLGAAKALTATMMMSASEAGPSDDRNSIAV